MLSPITVYYRSFDVLVTDSIIFSCQPALTATVLTWRGFAGRGLGGEQATGGVVELGLPCRWTQVQIPLRLMWHRPS